MSEPMIDKELTTDTKQMNESMYEFFKEPCEKLENAKVIVSRRYRDSKGKLIEWEIKPLSYERIASLREECQKKGEMTVQGKKVGMRVPDTAKFNVKFCTEAIVFPDLKTRDLQDAYGVRGEEALLTAMLTAAEIDNLIDIVNDICGYSQDFDHMVDDSKN